jgi:hypothetical protein
VRKRFEAFGASADSLRRTVGRDQIGIFRFERFKMFEQRVEFGVGDFRLTLLIIKFVVSVDFAAQRFDFGFG